MKKIIYFLPLLLLTLVLLFIGYSFHTSNSESVALNYLGFSWTGSVAALVGGVFVFGLVLGAFTVWVLSLKLKFQVRQSKKRLEKVEKEVQNLRALPIKNDV